MSLLQGFETMRLVKTGPNLRQRLEWWVAKTHRKVTIARLRHFRQQMEQDMQPDSWTELEAPMVLLFSDVCDTLGLTEEEKVDVLGMEGVSALTANLETRIRPVTKSGMLINERQAKALRYVREHGKLDLSVYREICPFWSDETLRLDLTGLVARGLLARNGSTKGTHYILAS
jgi:hypothetical protein